MSGGSVSISNSSVGNDLQINGPAKFYPDRCHPAHLHHRWEQASAGTCRFKRLALVRLRIRSAAPS